MKVSRFIFVILLVVALAGAIGAGRKVRQLRTELGTLRAENNTLQEENATLRDSRAARENLEIEKLRAQAQEVQKLRNEVSQLRKGTEEAGALKAENQRLREIARAAPAVPSPEPAATARDHFPKESWSFAGYASPETALVSAIAAMRDGNPKTYWESLAPEEQARLGKVWEGKSELELAAKHQQDVSRITGLRILGRQEVSPQELLMDVYIEGVGRMEKVSMKQVGSDWKFAGYRRDPVK